MSEQNGRLQHDPWSKVTKRMAAKARGAVRSGSGNFAIINISIVVDAQGLPVGWICPTDQRTEPRGPWLLDETDLVEKID